MALTGTWKNCGNKKTWILDAAAATLYPVSSVMQTVWISRKLYYYYYYYAKIMFAHSYSEDSYGRASVNKLCVWRHNMPPPISSPLGALTPHAPPSRRNVAILSHAEYVPTLTAAAPLRVKAAPSKAAWWLTLTFDLMTWKWCPSHVWCGLSLCQFWSS